MRSPLSKTVFNWIELRQYSPLVGRIQEVEDHSGRKVRVFFSKELLSNLKEDVSRIEENMMSWIEKATADW